MRFQAVEGQLVELLGADGSPLMRAIQDRFCSKPGLHGNCITVFHSGPSSLMCFVPDPLYGELQAMLRDAWERSRQHV